jgi:hypothetical protein
MTVTRGGKKSRKNVKKCIMQLTAHHRQSYCTSFTSNREDRSTTRLAARTAHRASAPWAQHASRAIPATSTSTIPNSRRRRAIILLLPRFAARGCGSMSIAASSESALSPVHRDIDRGSVAAGVLGPTSFSAVPTGAVDRGRGSA